jgi:multiple sugar transport system substrate-binding protein
MSRRRALGAIGSLALAPGACSRTDEGVRPPGPLRVVFKHTPLGEPGPLRRLIAAFERAHPGVVVSAELLPSAPDAIHQYLLTSLEGQTRDFDVFIADVIWVAEMARAGWIMDLSKTFPPEDIRRHFLPGPASAVVIQGGTFAVPWYADTGVFYHRKDLVPRPPATYAELAEAALRTARRRSLHGHVWQGLQSEALICNAYETIWGFSGVEEMESIEGRFIVDTPSAREALGFMRSLLVSGVSPPSVTSMGEEESRRVFQSGAAVFMRNWPYAFAELEGPGSPVRGLVGMAPLPSAHGAPTPRWPSSPTSRRPRPTSSSPPPMAGCPLAARPMTTRASPRPPPSSPRCSPWWSARSRAPSRLIIP